MICLAVACESSTDSNELIQAIEMNQLFKTRLYGSARNLIQDLNRGIIQGVVFGVRDFNPQKTHILKFIRTRLGTKPLILVGDSFPDSVVQYFGKNQNLCLFLKSEEIKHISGLLKKMLLKAKIERRQDFRHTVQLDGYFMANGKSADFQTVDVSNSGSRIYNFGRSVTPGESIKLHFISIRQTELCEIQAKVIWQKIISSKFQKNKMVQEVGLQFQHRTDIGFATWDKRE